MHSNSGINSQLNELVEKYTSNTCSREELEQLLLLVREANTDQPLEEALQLYWEKVKAENKQAGIDWDAKMRLLLEEVNAQTPMVHINRKFNWKRIAVAASLIMLLGLGYWALRPKQAPVKGALATKDIVAPIKNRAMITLSNGEKVELDEQQDGTVIHQGNTTVVKTAGGKVIYAAAGSGTATSGLYNTLSNPRGSKVVEITLSDGSMAWLNAGSSITYPVAFSGGERRVQLSGEAYFEVVHDTRMPFKVSKNNMEVTVLGTHFNVNAYDDESAIRVTLLEGAVRTALNNKQAVVLKPGQQAQVINDIKVLKDVDVQKVVAWKQEMFSFHETNIKEVMRQVARWYDVDVEFRGDVSQVNFGGSISRKASLSELLKILEETNLVKFELTGRKLTVIPR
ncbi:FecR family protein [Chitinophaga eiseniae]|uniref:DUF4974 domain-containing protein n=1 Tax=Chitinophaga eiseniae TaxID=634771 RepID=A0A847SF76_9BACT|nr:FecR family protein [Chitinophaga eiseniae]NLR78413.1 DUF4974 domain-containing protein [Chitinophaga eiseniae]